MKSRELKLSAEMKNLEAFVTFIGNKLKELGVDRKVIARSLLCSEELLAELIKHSSSSDSMLVLKINSSLGKVSIKMTCEGEAFSVDDIKNYNYVDGLDEESNNVISSMLEKIFGEHIGCINKHGKNICDMVVSTSNLRSLYVTLISLVLGLLAGFLMKLTLSNEVSNWFVNYIFSPITTMFINALKALVAPLVFFSIAASIADFKNIKSLGNIALKVVGAYFLTSLLAIATGFFVYQLIPAGDSSLQAIISDSANSYIETSKNVSITLKDTIVGIIPKTIVEPFVESNMLQIILLAALVGVVVSSAAAKLPGCNRFLSEGNYLFGQITSIVIKVLPVTIFCSIAKIVLSMNYASLVKVFGCIPVCYLGNVIMISIYMLLILLFARINPFKFIQKFLPVTLIGFGLSSSNGSMPYTMECCDKKLGVSRKLYSFSIPLGATLNMDGTCISLMVVSLFFAKIFGIDLTGGQLFSVVLSIIVLSMGAPGIPGTNLICTALLLPQLGVPMEALSIIMGVHTLIGMGNAATNITGDAAISTIIAKNQKMIDLDVYNS